MSSHSAEKGDLTPPTSRSESPQKSEVVDDFGDINEGKLLRKLDLNLLPAVSILYLLSFLDRANIGNAKVAGLVTDLNLDGLKYNLCVAVFYFSYPFAEIPTNLAMKIFRPSRFIPCLMVAWSIVMTLMSLVKSYEGLIAARLILGFAEAGVFPAVIYYLSKWYKRSEQSLRIALFFTCATVAGAFGGILAFGIEKMEGIAGLHGWAWIFLLEGIFTFICAVGAFLYIHDYPETVKFLTERERAFVVHRLNEDSSGLSSHLSGKFVVQAAKDWRTWMHVGLYLGVITPVYALSIFIPSIIQGLGYSAANAQLLTIPPYASASLATVFVGLASDKKKSRGPFLLASITIAIAGYGVLYGTSTPGAGYAGVFIASLGVFPSIPVVLSWMGNNAGGDVKRGAVLAIVTGIANLGGVMASFVYRTGDAPRYLVGHGVMLGILCMSWAICCIAMVSYKRANDAKTRRCEAEGIDESRLAEFAELGDDSPLFRYLI